MKRIPVLTALSARWHRMVLVFGAIALWTITVFAAVPHLINFQGVLKNVNGSPVADGSYSIKFDIFDAVGPGGGCLWTETQLVAVQNGQFSVLLGSANAAGIPDTAFNSPDRWLAITVGNDPEMAPRQRLGSVGYSYRVGTVDGATGGIIYGNTSIQSDLAVGGGMNAHRLILREPSPGQALSTGEKPAFTEISILVIASALQTTNLFEIMDASSAPIMTVDPQGNTSVERLQVADAGNFDGEMRSPVVKVDAKPGQTEDMTKWSVPAPGGGSNTVAVVDASGNVGIGTGSPHSTLDVNGSFSTNVSIPILCSDFTLNANHSIVLVNSDACTEERRVHLPTAVGISGRQYTIKHVGSNPGYGPVSVWPVTGELIEGATWSGFIGLTSWITLVSDGTGWVKIGGQITQF